MGSDMMSLCRLCLMENTIMLPIFGEDGKHRRIREMIKESLNIALFQTDPLPRKICCKCYFKLQQANELKSDCQKSTKVLINHMNAQRSADAAKMIKTLNYQLQILHGNAPPGEPQKEPEAFGPSRVVVASASGGVGSSSTNHFPQSIRHRNHRLPPFSSVHRGAGTQARSVQQMQQQRQAASSTALQPQVQLAPVHTPRLILPKDPEQKSDTHECHLCFRICKSEGILKMHIATVHKEINSAGQRLSIDAGPEAASSENPALDNLKCSLCHQPFRNVNGLVGHLRTAHGKPSCAICLEIFSTQEDLNAHRQTHKPGYSEQQAEKKIPPPDVFTCPICGKSFDNSTSLSRHKGYHTKMGPNWSPSVGSTSNSTVSSPTPKSTTYRQSIIESESPRKVFTCDICGKKFDNNLSLARHRACHAKYGAQRSLIPPQRQISPPKPASDDYEPVEKKPVLDDQGKIVDRVSLQKLKSNSTTIPFCLYCKKIYESQDKLWEHICTMHPNDPRYRCQDSGCLRVFFSGTGFRSHQTAQGHNAPPETANSNKSVDSGPSMVFLSSDTSPVVGSSSKCQICMRKFSNINNLRRHIKMAHRNQSSFMSKQIVRHNPSSIASMYGRKIGRVLCRYCPKYLSSKYISEHEKMHRIRGDKPRAARDNGQQSQEVEGPSQVDEGEGNLGMEPEEDLEEDEEQEDTPINSSFEMDIPDSITMTQNQDFKLNRKIPRAPNCKYCGHTALSFYELQEHLDSNHPGQIYYVCEGCPEIYFDRKTLVSHNIVHTRVYLNCKYCNKSFARPLALRGHENRCLYLQKKQQGLMPESGEGASSSTSYSYTCEFCNDKFNDSITFVQHLQTHATTN
ncbi:zinc finger protein 135-like isoform X3 [Neocloeon triangulifer]|uniref:zinc finger protein 135-like isoform X3 n=1 Tax=Neocloeon triangulifer TaxID=2078957 RepID=UPI00286EC638|nr:zinc finger protein 135-like isoform X3 [Neocloeon triangulifer]